MDIFQSVEVEFFIQESVTKFFLVLFLGLIVRESFRVLNQSWANSASSFLVFGLLPVATFSVTSIIAGDVALSLGMVGALSIVRFRNPVRSPAELVAYFILITVGICVTKNLPLGILLVAGVFIINHILRLLIKNKFFGGVSLFGFNDMSQNFYIVAKSTKELPTKILSDFENYLCYERAVKLKDEEHEYRWETTNKNEALRLAETLRGNKIVLECVLSMPSET